MKMARNEIRCLKDPSGGSFPAGIHWSWQGGSRRISTLIRTQFGVLKPLLDTIETPGICKSASNVYISVVTAILGGNIRKEMYAKNKEKAADGVRNRNSS